MGILERIERIHRAHGNIETICKGCNKPETIKFYDSDGMSLPKGSFTTKCGCGCFVYRFHNIMLKPDPHHKTSYFTKAWSPARTYDKDYADKDFVEKEGFVKQKNGKYVR